MRSANILVVDDSKDIHVLIKLALMKVADLKINFFTEGAIAREAVLGLAPDLVLLDVRMPTWDGKRTFNELRAVGYKGPVIFLTAEDGEAEALLALGASKVVHKPFPPDDLLDMLS